MAFDDVARTMIGCDARTFLKRNPKARKSMGIPKGVVEGWEDGVGDGEEEEEDEEREERVTRGYPTEIAEKMLVVCCFIYPFFVISSLISFPTSFLRNLKCGFI